MIMENTNQTREPIAQSRRSERLRLRSEGAAAAHALGRGMRQPSPIATAQAADDEALVLYLPVVYPYTRPPPNFWEGPVLLRREFEAFEQNAPEGCTAELVNNNILRWMVSMPGTPGTPYEGGKFYMFLLFEEDYPYAPVDVRFLTRIYHSNVTPCGTVCARFLELGWSMDMNVCSVLVSLRSLLADPDPEYDYRYEIDRSEFEAKARDWTSLYANPEAPAPNPDSGVEPM